MRLPSIHMIMKVENICPNGGVGSPSSIRHGVQLKTKINIEDSNELAISPQNSTCFFSIMTFNAPEKSPPPPPAFCPKFSFQDLKMMYMHKTRKIFARSKGVM